MKTIAFLFIFALAGTIPASIGSIDDNFWENHVLSETLNPACSTVPATDWSCSFGETDQFQISYTASSANTLSYQDIPSDASCQPDFLITKKKDFGDKALSNQNDSTINCSEIAWLGNNYLSNGQPQLAFDTLTFLIENCSTWPDASDEFSQITAALQALYGPTMGTYRATYLSWLESVLYLNTSDAWFCADAEEIAEVLPLPYDTTPGAESRYINIPLSVINWLIHQAPCDTASLEEDYNQSRFTQLQQWNNDPGAYPLDTTLLPISTWGLDTLFAKHFLYSVGTPQGILSNISAYPNPTGSGTVISFGISQEAYVKIELFDVLGHQVASAGFESLFEPGNKAVPISLAGLPSGTYFARIQTNYGEAQSIKIVKN